MNTKTLISALVLTLGLGSLALPGTAAARDYGRDGDRHEHRRDRHDNDRGRHERRDHRRDRHEHRRHDRGRHYGHHRHYPYPYVQHRHHRHWNNGYFLMDPLPIIHIETRW